MKKFKKMLVGLLACCMVLSNIPVQILMATDAAVAVEETETTNGSVVSSEPTVTSIVFRTTEVFEGTANEQTGYNSETGQYEKYMRYEYAPNCTVTFGDGTSVSSENGWIHYNGYQYYTGSCCQDTQGVGSEWGLGDHQVEFELLGYKTTCTITVVENPIESFVCEDINVIVGTGGYNTQGYDSETETYKEYFYYHATPKFRITFKDGMVVDHPGQFEYKGETYYVSYWANNQNYENQWTLGNTYTGTAAVFGMSVTYNVNIVETPVSQIICQEVEIMEYTQGQYQQKYDDKTDEYIGEYFHYNINPIYTLVFKDGTVMENQQNSTFYNNEWYQFTSSTDQSYENQWIKGNTYTAHGSVLGAECSYEVSIVGSPIQTFDCKDIEIIEGTNGYFTKDYDPQTGTVGEYYYYMPNAKFDVTFNDGTQMLNQNYGINYNGQWYSVSTSYNQHISNQWQVGNTYKVDATLLGATDSFNVTIVESPIKNITIDDITIIEGTHQQYTQEWDDETQTSVGYNKYVYSAQHGTIVMKDGATYEFNGSGFQYDDRYYEIEILDDQSYSNQWGIGKYQVTAVLMGVETTVNVEIIECPYVSLEILNVAPITENENCWKNGDQVIYTIPSFTYRVHLKDGTTEVGYYNSSWYNEGISCSSTQYGNPWTVGGENYFTVNYNGLQVKAPVEIIAASEFEYEEIDGAVYINNCKSTAKKIEIPSEIDGKPVKGLWSLGFADDTVEEIVIPDSVTLLGGHVFSGWNLPLKSITIGSGVEYIDYYMFEGCRNLENVFVSEDNPYYCSIDGVLYDKNVEELIYYPLVKGTVYTVPATVKNIDILNQDFYREVIINFDENSTAFVIEDGITYNADKTKIIRCNPDKTGEYIIPDTVEEIAEYAFMGCSNITKIVMSDKIVELSDYIFAECSTLAEVVLSDNLQIIGNGAFLYTSLTEIAIPDGVTEIGYDAFWNVPLESVSFGTSLEYIDDYAFSGTSLKEVTIPDGVTLIGYNAFGYCNELQEVTIGRGVTDISMEAFAYNPNLTKVTILGTDVSIYEWAFMSCPKLQEVNFDGVSFIGEYAFAGTALTHLTLPEGVTAVAYSAFAGCSSLSQIDVPESLVEIGVDVFAGTAWEESQEDEVIYLEHILYKYQGNMSGNTTLDVKEGTTAIAGSAFNSCYNLIEVNLPESLKVINEYAFTDCTKLEKVNIPASVTWIGWLAFDGCKLLDAINVDATNAEYTSVDGVLFNKDCTELIWCPLKNIEDYTIPNSVEYVWEYAFSNSDILNFTISNPNTELGYYCIGYNSWGQRNTKDITIICPEDSLAYEYVKENLMMKNAVESIAIETLPIRTTYAVGENFDPMGMQIKATHTNGSVSYVLNGFGAILFDSSEEGTQEVTVEYCGKSTSFEVEVIDRGDEDVPTPPTEPEEPDTPPVEPDEPVTIEKASIHTYPVKLTYEMGEALDITGMSIVISYSDGSTEIVSDNFTVSGFDSSVAGEQTVVVSQEEKGVSVAFVVTINEPIIDEPEIKKAEVLIGNAAGKPGDEVQVSISLKEEATIKSIAISDFEYDKEKLELVGAEWNLNGVLSDWGTVMDNAGVLTFANNTAVKGDVLTFTFRILDDVEDGSCEIACQVIAKEMLESGEEQNLDVTVTFGEIIIKNVIRGDVNGDGYVTSDDAIYLLYHTTNGAEYPINQDGDFDGNGYVTSDDAIYLLYHVMLPAQYPINK